MINCVSQLKKLSAQQLDQRGGCLLVAGEWLLLRAGQSDCEPAITSTPIAITINTNASTGIIHWNHSLLPQDYYQQQQQS